MNFILGFIVGGLVLSIYYLFSKRSFFKSKSKEQSVVLLEKIRSVSKLITVEGSMNEVMHFQDEKNSILNMISSTKKAIVMANAKVFIGFDMKKMRFDANSDKRQIRVTSFPDPEVLGMETHMDFYDIKNGLFNKFEATDLTELNKKVKQNFTDKIPESDLLHSAKLKAMDTLKVMEQMVGTFGWELKYDALNDSKNLSKVDVIKKLLS
ncbi:MAG: DUF4230 domain-containing protein [Flavobacteriaceae bacterium]